MASPNFPPNNHFQPQPQPPPPSSKPPRHPPPPPPSAKPPRHPPPPPPHHPIKPPPPHHPIRPPPPPSPSPDNHTPVIVIIFGGLLFLAFIAAAICYYIKKKKKKVVQETDLVHFKVKEEIVPGPHGPKVVKLEIEDDVHVDEVIKKNEHSGAGLHAKSSAERDNPSITLDK
ncbi:hypothetical protein AB3S75_011551 [Citrus x aurantiifolia]